MEQPQQQQQAAKRKDISERLAQVITMGRDKGRLTYDELNNLLPEDVASPEEIDALLTLLGKENIEIVDKPSATPASRLEDREEKEQREEEAAELVEVGQLDDPVKMYLRQMGQIPLLTREQELALAKKIEAAEFAYRDAVLQSPITRREILRLSDILIEGGLNPEDYSKDDPNLKREELVAQLVVLRRRLKQAKSKTRSRKVIEQYHLTIQAIEWLVEQVETYLHAVETAERQIVQTKRSSRRGATVRLRELYQKRKQQMRLLGTLPEKARAALKDIAQKKRCKREVIDRRVQEFQKRNDFADGFSPADIKIAVRNKRDGRLVLVEPRADHDHVVVFGRQYGDVAILVAAVQRAVDTFEKF